MHGSWHWEAQLVSTFIRAKKKAKTFGSAGEYLVLILFLISKKDVNKHKYSNKGGFCSESTDPFVISTNRPRTPELEFWNCVILKSLNHVSYPEAQTRLK